MRVRRARALVVVFRDTQPVVYNFLTQQAFACDAQALGILAHVANWQPLDSLFDALLGFDPQSVARELFGLIEQGALLLEGSPAAARDAEYDASWDWGASAGLYHFGLKYTRFVAPSTLADWFAERREERGVPQLYTTNEMFAAALPLPEPSHRQQPFALMRRRRSARRFGPEPLSQQALGDCLFAGLGITGFADDPLIGRAPLKMTPSGGARNPYEGYVYACNVADLDPGIYHYSALEHTLGPLPSAALPPIRMLLSGQDWADPAAAVILLVAHFDRTMWKYAHPSGYRVALIEAGHVAQNILLAATAHDLAAAPTAALDDHVIDHALELTALNQAAVYAVALGSRAASGAGPPELRSML